MAYFMQRAPRQDLGSSVDNTGIAAGVIHEHQQQGAPSEAEVAQMEALARAEYERAGRIEAISERQLGTVRREMRRRDRRKAAKQARKRNKTGR